MWDKSKVDSIDEIKAICEEYGYGHVMDIAAKLWGKNENPAAFVIGPCKGFAVACGCNNPAKCDWCCGCGWLTKKVKYIKIISKATKMSDRLKGSET